MTATDTPRALTTTVTNGADQPDLRGNMAPVGDELDVATLPVTGVLPAGLRGAFVRNGPNPAFEPVGRYHMFDGDGMLHAVTFRDGTVSYRNRWIRSRGLGAEIAHGAAIYPGLGEVMHFPDRGSPGRGTGEEPGEHPYHPPRGSLPGAVGRRAAHRGGRRPGHDRRARLRRPARGPMTAHPRLDPRTGEMLFFAYSLFEPYLRYHVVDATGALVHSVAIDLPAPVMMHDFVITEDHAVFLDSPIVFNMESLGEGPMVSWRPENGARIGVMPRLGARPTSPGTRSKRAMCSTSGTAGSTGTESSSVVRG